MKRTVFFGQLSPFGQLLLLFGLILVFAITVALVGLYAGMMFFNISMADISSFVSNPDTPESILFIKFYQVLNQIGIFILPALLFSFLVSNNTFEYLSLNRLPLLISLLLAGMIIYSILPFNNYLDDLNRHIKFPNFLSGVENWMLAKEDQARKLTKVFLNASTVSGLFLNIFVVALVPAIGEELLFRGVLLKLFNGLFKNIHIAVVISALVFSAIHFQFFGFLPRALLGILLGYLFVFSGNLWVPIFAHFLNNASSAIIYYLHQNGHIKVSMDNFGTSTNTVYIIGSLLISLWLLMIIFQKEGSKSVL
jgi:membrane protease YdiL (CAAX protease family)